jgi:PRC-barrel domain
VHLIDKRAGLAAIAALTFFFLHVAAGAQAQMRGDDGAAPQVKLESILGREVSNRDGDGGRVIDVLTDLDGNLRAVVIEFGGFLGIGTRKIAVEWSALRFVREGERVLLVADVGRDQLRQTPEYKATNSPVVAPGK